MNTSYLYFAQGNYETALPMAKKIIEVINGKGMSKANKKIFVLGLAVMMKELMDVANDKIFKFYETEQDEGIHGRGQELSRKIYDAYRVILDAANDIDWELPRVARNELPERVREICDYNYDFIREMKNTVEKALPSLESIITDLETFRNLYK